MRNFLSLKSSKLCGIHFKRVSQVSCEVNAGRNARYAYVSAKVGKKKMKKSRAFVKNRSTDSVIKSIIDLTVVF